MGRPKKRRLDPDVNIQTSGDESEAIDYSSHDCSESFRAYADGHFSTGFYGYHLMPHITDQPWPSMDDIDAQQRAASAPVSIEPAVTGSSTER